MVRTLRSLEEEARVRRIGGPGLDCYLARRELAEVLDGWLLADLIRWASEGVRRVLVVGLEDQGRLALAMASEGRFVTAVDPDEKLVQILRDKAQEQKCAIRMNFYTSDYMKKDFATSGFDLVCFFSALTRYNEPITVVKKATRELRAGGKFFARFRVRPPWPITESVREKVTFLAKTEAWARELISRIGVLERFASLPDAASFVREVSSVLKLERVEKVHMLAPVLAAVLTRAPSHAPGVLKVIAAISKGERELLARFPWLGILASYVVVFATKELGLGKTFRLNDVTSPTSPLSS